jgi:hypothetical protein
MSKRRYIGVTIVVLAAVALAGGLIASNMGFKLNKALVPTGGAVAGVGEVAPFTSANGTNSLGLPFNRQAGLNTAGSLKVDIGTNWNSTSKLLRSSNQPFTYNAARSGTGSIDFALEEGNCYQVRVTSTGTAALSYIVVGSDDPAYPYPLIVAGNAVPEGGTSSNGTNGYAYKYHATAATAGAIKAEIGSQCVSVSKLLGSNNQPFTYNAARSGTGSIDFPLIPGECYNIRVTSATNTDIPYTASHY